MSVDKVDDKCVFLSHITHFFDFIDKNSYNLPSTASEIREINSDCIYFIEDVFFVYKPHSKKIANMIKDSFNVSTVYSIENSKDTVVHYNLTLYKIEK